MTKEQANQNSQDKLKAIETLCRQLQMTVSAEQKIIDGGFIKHIVFYTDNEKYDIQETKIEETPDLREQDVDAGLRVRAGDVRSSQKAESGADRGDVTEGGEHPDTGIGE